MPAAITRAKRKKRQQMQKWLGVTDQLQQGAIKGILRELWANGYKKNISF